MDSFRIEHRVSGRFVAIVPEKFLKEWPDSIYSKTNIGAAMHPPAEMPPDPWPDHPRR